MDSMDDLGLAYRRHAAPARRLALRILRDAREAEDVVQDCFLQLWARRNTAAAPPSHELQYVSVLVKSRAIDRLRARRAVQRTLAKVGVTEATPPPTPRLPAETARLSAALRSLSPLQAGALKHAYVDGLSHTEIARRMSCPLGTVKARLRLGLQRLAALLEEG